MAPVFLFYISLSRCYYFINLLTIGAWSPTCSISKIFPKNSTPCFLQKSTTMSRRLYDKTSVSRERNRTSTTCKRIFPKPRFWKDSKVAIPCNWHWLALNEGWVDFTKFAIASNYLFFKSPQMACISIKITLKHIGEWTVDPQDLQTNLIGFSNSDFSYSTIWNEEVVRSIRRFDTSKVFPKRNCDVQKNNQWYGNKLQQEEQQKGQAQKEEFELIVPPWKIFKFQCKQRNLCIQQINT